MTGGVQPGSGCCSLVWCLICAVLGLLYLPLVPPVLFSIEPATAGAGATLAAYGKMWQSPLLRGAVATSLQTAVIVAVVATVLALAAAMAIRELKMPRLILVLMLLPLFVPGISMGLAVAFFFNGNLWGLSALAILAAMNDTNGGMFLALTSTMGTPRRCAVARRLGQISVSIKTPRQGWK